MTASTPPRPFPGPDFTTFAAAAGFLTDCVRASEGMVFGRLELTIGMADKEPEGVEVELYSLVGGEKTVDQLIEDAEPLPSWGAVEDEETHSCYHVAWVHPAGFNVNVRVGEERLLGIQARIAERRAGVRS